MTPAVRSMVEHKLVITDDECDRLESIPLTRIGTMAQRALDAGAAPDSTWFVTTRNLHVTWKTPFTAAPIDEDAS